jgi:hypothetical protein
MLRLSVCTERRGQVKLSPMAAKDARTFDRVSGTRLGTLWFLPAYALILVPLALLLRTDSAGLSAFWGVVGVVAGVVFCWAFCERRVARRALRQLREDMESASQLRYLGEEVSGLDTLVQYEVVVGLVALEARFLTCPRLKASPVLPTLATLLLGWWSLPFGPISTILAVISNLRGPTQRSVTSLLVELQKPEPVKSPWWKRTLGLDSGSPVKAVANLAILLVLVFVVAIVITTIVRELVG